MNLRASALLNYLPSGNVAAGGSIVVIELSIGNIDNYSKLIVSKRTYYRYGIGVIGLEI